MRDPVTWADGGELLCEVPKSCGVELILVRLHDCQRSPYAALERLPYFQVPQLGELFPAVIKLASKGLDLLVDDLVGAHVASLCECFTTFVAAVRTLASMSSLVRLKKKSGL